MNINSMKLLLSSVVLLFIVNGTLAYPVMRRASGATPAAIQPMINTFFADLGGLDNGTGGSFKSGRRSVDLSLVPDNLAEPNYFYDLFFRSQVPRGALMTQNCNGGERVAVSADLSNPTNTPLVFANIDPSYLGNFTTYNSQRLLGVVGTRSGSQCSSARINFSIPGTDIPATVGGFGIIFSDVDVAGQSSFHLFDINGKQVGYQTYEAIPINGGLSFVGVTFTNGERIASVKVDSGNFSLAPGSVDGINGTDVVAVAAMFYGEPRASQFHSGDADGDGLADARIFRPSTGTWYTLNSGSSTVSITQWGLNGDVPVDGDFDGDSIADLAIYRPSNGAWFVAPSSDTGSSNDLGFIIRSFGGQPGDRPVAADYDKDGITDIAIWRPSNGNYFVLRSNSSFNNFYSFPFGQPGDIPVQGGAQ